MNIRLILGALLGAALLSGMTASASPILSVADWPFHFDVYFQEGVTIDQPGTPVRGAGVDGPYGELVRSLGPDRAPFYRVTQFDERVRVEIQDYPIVPHFDITADFTSFIDGLPTRVEVVYGEGAGSSSATWRYIYDFVWNGEVLVPRWQMHYGEVFDLPAIPEPATLSLLALGGAVLVRRRPVAWRKDRP